MRRMPKSHAVEAAELFVQDELTKLGHDASHDWWHIERVRNVALKIAEEEGLQGTSLEVVELSSLLHDVQDWKYSKSMNAGVQAVQAFLASQNLSADIVQQVIDVISGVGFKDELGQHVSNVSPVLAAVQDADRLDAIGAIGIARCFTFGGRFLRPLYDPAIPPRVNLTKETYMAQTEQQTTINHFHEKLLLLKGLMKTAAGRRLAEGRHAFMEEYLQHFHAECSGQA